VFLPTPQTFQVFLPTPQTFQVFLPTPEILNQMNVLRVEVGQRLKITHTR